MYINKERVKKMRENKALGIFDFDDFAMEMTSTELLFVNGGACGGGFRSCFVGNKSKRK